MILLRSEIIPKSSGLPLMRDKFQKELSDADSVTIVAGYTSAETLAFLGAFVEANEFIRSPKSTFSVVVGMADAQGLHPTILGAANRLDGILKRYEIGSVATSRDWPLHAKVYLFERDGEPFSAIIGSSNSSALVPGHRLGELDIFTDDKQILSELRDFIRGPLERSLVSIDSIKEPRGTPPKGSRHPGRDDFYADIFGESLDILKGVERVSEEKLSLAKSLVDRDLTFRHRLTVGQSAAKSNLNAALGKGRLRRRKDGSTWLVPRPWYEVELILSSEEIDSGFAPPEFFTAITDDGWTFEMKRQGDNLKNLRSLVDLRPLGLWMKGRLEDAGCLVVGDLVTEQTLKNYGNDSLRLTPLPGDLDGSWFVEFPRNWS